MLKADRDQAMNTLSDQDRSAYRGMVRDVQAERKMTGRLQPNLREELGARLTESPPGIRGALEALIARDETGPKVGEQPPDFFLKLKGSPERVRLSGFRGQRPVALVFGSYT